MKKKLALALIALLILTSSTSLLAATVNPFKDVKTNSWYYKDVLKAYEQGYIKGVTADRFEPTSNITRSMFVSILYRLAASPKVEYNYKFNDVHEKDWDANAVAWALQNDIANKLTDNTFGRDTRVTREEMVKMFYRYSYYKQYNISHNTDLKVYSDYKKLNLWSEYAFGWAIQNKIIGGKENNTLAPQDKVTRAELATVLNRFCENVVPKEAEKYPCTITYHMNNVLSES